MAISKRANPHGQLQSSVSSVVATPYPAFIEAYGAQTSSRTWTACGSGTSGSRIWVPGGSASPRILIIADRRKLTSMKMHILVITHGGGLVLTRPRGPRREHLRQDQ